LKLNLDSIKNNRAEWIEHGFQLPAYKIEDLRENTKTSPKWIHFGAGNIFRMFVARVQDELLDQGIENTGVIIAETFDSDKVDYIFKPYDNLSTAVTLKSNGEIDLRVVGCIAEAVKAEMNKEGWQRAIELFKKSSLQVVSFTITEKGYSLVDTSGQYTNTVKTEMQDPDMKSTNTMGIVCRLLYERFKAGKLPLTLSSMDNVSHNGALLKNAILAYAKAWTDAGFMEKEFYEYVQDEALISFPWAMIDKITPVADSSVAKMLSERGYEDYESLELNGRFYPPSFANAEETEYLVIEDNFTNGRPNWDKGGIIFAEREIVDRVETMKVTTCLNPLHTALAVYGSLLGYDRINEEMKDDDLVNLIKGIGYLEGLPVVVDPEILDPKAFIDTVIEQRFPNPFLPDTPQRIATDTSQKMAIRFGKTLQEYKEKNASKISELRFIPAVIAGWLRYLLAIDDSGEVMELSPDPLLEDLQLKLQNIEYGRNDNVEETLLPLLSNQDLFGIDLIEINLADQIIDNFKILNQGPGSIRKFLQSLPKYDAID